MERQEYLLTDAQSSFIPFHKNLQMVVLHTPVLNPSDQ